MPGRKRVGVVPNGTTRTSAASARHPRNSSTERARSAVQRLFAATTEHRARMWRAVQRLNTERRIFASSSRKSAPCAMTPRSEEHTSELQSRLHLVCRLLLEKKK